MNWTNFGLVAIAVLALQARSTLSRPDQPSYVYVFGALTLLLAVLGFVSWALLLVGRLVFSPEFGRVMAEGSPLALGSLIAGFCVAGGVGWHLARAFGGWPNRLPILAGVGLVIGLAAATRVLPLSPDEPGALPLYAYDLWWPIPLLWLTVCVTEVALVVLRVGAAFARWWAVTLLMAGMSLFALRRPEFGDPWSPGLWKTTLVGAGMLALGLSAIGLRKAMAARRRGGLRLPSLRWPTLRQSALLLALAMISLSVVFPFVFYVYFDPHPLFAMFIVGWTLMAELTAGGPLRDLAQTLLSAEVPRARALLSEWWRPLRGGAVRAASGIWVRAKTLASVDNWPTALVKAIGLVVVVIAASEVPNAGKTVIEPFNASSPAGPDKLGRALADRVFHGLQLLDEQMQPSVITPEASQVGRVQHVAARAGTTTTSAALGDQDIPVGSVRVPLKLFSAPVQVFMRWLLKVRVITGSIEADGTRYAGFATTSTGKAWTVDAHRDVSDTSLARGTIDSIAERLAFEIISTDPKLAPPGMTTSWDAFQSFQAGFRAWSDFDARKEADALTYDALSRAIESFREATKKDPKFALAHYRLGMALEADGQPMAAAQAFRAALRADPHFAAGYNALAYHLANFDNYYFPTAAALDPKRPSAGAARASRSREARDLWQRVIRFEGTDVPEQDKASAYYGLCWDAFDARQYAAAYFYCQRAAGVYANLPREVVSAQRVSNAQAATLNVLAVALQRRRPALQAVSDSEWSCVQRWVDSAGAVAPSQISHSPNAAAALRYYRRSLSLQPNDQTVQCNAASAAYALGDKQPMRALELVAAAHRDVADAYANDAKEVGGEREDVGSESQASAYYHLALAEYQRAVELDPADVLAMNGYAYAFWTWRLRWPSAKGPNAVMAKQAEDYARSAVALTHTQRSALEPTVRSTLGEVLLAQARPHEAIAVLQDALDPHLAPVHAVFDEVRWDLAQALLCAAYNDENAHPPLVGAGDDVVQMRAHAAVLLDGIHQDEQGREFGPFSAALGPLDPARPQIACRRGHAPQSRADSVPPWFRMATPQYSSYVSCKWMGVVGDATGDRGSVANLRLHIWGDGIDGRIRLGKPRDAVFLAYTPKKTHGEYFAQVEDAEWNPRSAVYEIETFANDREDRCTRNEIKLAFQQAR